MWYSAPLVCISLLLGISRVTHVIGLGEFAELRADEGLDWTVGRIWDIHLQPQVLLV